MSTVFYRVMPDTLMFAGEEVRKKTFEFLTGKKIDWSVREGRFIIVKRDGKKLSLHDARFIQGREYKHNRRIYVCTWVDSNGYAMLTPVSKNNMEIISPNDPQEWEIVT